MKIEKPGPLHLVFSWMGLLIRVKIKTFIIQHPTAKISALCKVSARTDTASFRGPKARRDGTCLQSQHLGDSGEKIRSSRPVWAT
jgi:hypothetical protein